MLNTEDRSFDDFYLSDEMRRALQAVDYTQPTRVQAESIPLILAGIDLTLQSQTGSGKTAAFAIPVIEMLEPRPGRIDVLVMTPTRELAKQVCDEFERLGKFKDLTAIAIYGGTSYEAQYKALEEASIVVATPGRLLDLCERKKVDLSELRILVLDEADEMLSMGFRDDIEAVMKYLPEERQSILCSATITEEIKALANQILFYPEFITFSSDSVAATDVTHVYFNVRGVGRPRDLLKVLEYEEPDSAIIFANTKNDTFTVTTFLKRHGYRADVLNGDLPQKEREKTLHALRQGKIDYIVATDVAARGIDISDLSHVINYMLPESAEVYIHRTGRTGRAGKKGKAISLIAPTEVGTFFQIRKMYDIKLQEHSLPTTQQIMLARQRRAIGELAEKLGAMETLPYGAHLRMAEELLTSHTELAAIADPVKLVARLLALGDQFVEGSLQPPANGRASQVADIQPEAEAADVVAEEAPEEEQDAAQPLEKEEPASATEEKEPSRARGDRSEKEDDASEGRRRGRRSSRRPRRGSEERAKAEAPAEEQEETAEADVLSGPEIDEDDATPRRSRRRARRGERPAEDAEEPGETTAESPATVAASSEGPSNTRKMYLNIGRNVFDTASEVVDMLCFLSGMDPEDFGKVAVESTYTFVHVRQDYFEDVVAALNGADWEGNTVTAEPARK